MFHQLVLGVAVSGIGVQNSNPLGNVPTTTSIINMADSHDRMAFMMVTKMKEEPMDVQSIEVAKEEVGLEFLDACQISSKTR